MRHQSNRKTSDNNYIHINKTRINEVHNGRKNLRKTIILRSAKDGTTSNNLWSVFCFKCVLGGLITIAVISSTTPPD